MSKTISATQRRLNRKANREQRKQAARARELAADPAAVYKSLEAINPRQLQRCANVMHKAWSTAWKNLGGDEFRQEYTDCVTDNDELEQKISVLSSALDSENPKAACAGLKQEGSHAYHNQTTAEIELNGLRKSHGGADGTDKEVREYRKEVTGEIRQQMDAIEDNLVNIVGDNFSPGAKVRGAQMRMWKVKFAIQDHLMAAGAGSYDSVKEKTDRGTTTSFNNTNLSFETVTEAHWETVSQAITALVLKDEQAEADENDACAEYVLPEEAKPMVFTNVTTVEMRDGVRQRTEEIAGALVDRNTEILPDECEEDYIDEAAIIARRKRQQEAAARTRLQQYIQKSMETIADLKVAELVQLADRFTTGGLVIETRNQETGRMHKKANLRANIEAAVNGFGTQS